MKKIFPVVLVMFATAVTMAQNSTSTSSTTTINSTQTNTATPQSNTAAPEANGTISPRGISVYNRDTATTTDTLATTTASGDTTINQSGNAAGAATGTTVATLNDNQIAGVLVTIDDNELEAAKMAVRRARNEEVKDFARKMADDHKGNLADTKKMYKSYNKGTARSDVGVALQLEAKNANNQLAKSSRDGFDKAYIDEQVTLHEKALATLNETLLPNVADGTLKTHLEKTRTAVTEHLNDARTIQSKLQ